MGKRVVVARAEHIPQPSIGRLILGFLMAPLSATLAWGLLSPIVSPPYSISPYISPSLALITFLIALTIAVACTILFGIPAYLVLHRRVRPTLPRIALTGGLLGWISNLFFPGPEKWIQTYKIWDQLPPGIVIAEFRAFGLTGASGLIGGVVFWFCTVWRDPNFSNPVRS